MLATVALALAAYAAPGERAAAAPAAWFPAPDHPYAILPAAYADHLGQCVHHPGHSSYHHSYGKITSIQFTSPDGAYRLGDTVGIRVDTDKGIHPNSVDDVNHTRLALETGRVDRFAGYAGGNIAASNAYILYNYTVQPGDISADLDYNGTFALHFGSYTMADPVTNGPITCILPAPGGPGSLSASGRIVVVGFPQDTLVVADTPDNVYGKGREIVLAAELAEPAAYTGAAPSLVLDVGGVQRTAAYKSGNGTDRFLFSYVVGPGDGVAGDLDYHGTDSLNGAMANATGGPINRTLLEPGAAGSLSSLSGIGIDVAAPPLIPAGWATDDMGGFDALGAAADVDAIAVGGRTYAVVASAEGAVQLIRVHGNGTMEMEDEVRNSPPDLLLSWAYGVDAFYLGGAAHAIAAAHGGNAVQLLRIHANNDTLSPVDSLGDTGNNGNTGLELGGATRARVFEMNDTMHALVAGFNDDGVQLVRVHGNGTLEAKESWSLGKDEGDLELKKAFDAAVFDLGDEKHALVTGYEDDGVQMVQIHGNGTLEAGEKLADNGTLALQRPRGVAAFDLGGTVHALVASEADHGVQLVRIGGGGSLAPLGNATDGERGFARLAGATGITVLGGDGSGGVLAAVASRIDDGVQLVRVRGDGTLLPAGSAADDAPGFAELDGAHGIAAFAAGGSTYVLAAAIDDRGVQLVRTSAASVVNVTSAAANGTYAQGDAINITVTFDHPVRVLGPAELRLNSGGAAAFESGNNSTKLVFRYEVGRGDEAADLDRAAAGAPFAGGSIRDGALQDQLVGLALPAAGTGRSLGDLRDIEIDGVGQRIANVTSPDANDTYGTGTVINITVRFTEPVEFDPAGTRPEIPLDTGSAGGEHRHARCMPGAAASAELACAYEVRAGDATADLGYAANSSLELAGATARDGLGNDLASALLPDSPPEATLNGSKDIALDTAVPEVLRVTSPDDNDTYGRGSEIRIDVVFDGGVGIDPEPIDGDDSVPTLRLETGEDDRAARYEEGSGTDTLRFVYTVIAGDFSPGLNYTSAGALLLGHSRALVDEYGNRERSPVLPDPGSADSLGGQKDIEVRTVPTVDTVRANYTDTFLKVGQTVGVLVQFSEKVHVDAAPGGGEVPYVELETGRPGGGAQARAAYSSGTGTHTLEFSYPVHHADSTPVLNYTGTGALKASGASIRGAGAGANLTLPAPGPGGPLASYGIELRPNEAPKIGPLVNRTVGAGVELHVDVIAKDPERQPVTFSLAGAAPPGATINASTGFFAWTPTEAQRLAQGANSTYNITVRASDPYAASDTAWFAVTVVESPPAGYSGPTIAAIPDAAGREGEEIRLDIAVDGGEYGPYVYSLAADAEPPPPAGAAVHSNGTFSWTPGYDQNGTHTVTARAADRFGLDGTRSFPVSVIDAEPPWNLPPVIEAVDPQSADEGDRLVVRISAADPDAPIAYSLAGDPPGGAAIDPATGVFTWVIGYDAAGTHTITVSASDRYNRTSSLDFAVMVADREPPNLPPEIGPIPAQRATAGTALALQVNATDPNEGDILAFDLVDPPPGAVITTGGLFTWTPGRGQVGQHALNVTVADDRGLLDWAPLAVTVDDLEATAAAAEAVFAGPRTVRIDYSAPLGPPAGHEGPVYGSVSIGDGVGSAEPASVSGLGTRTHIVQLDGDAAGRDQNGTIRLLAGIEGVENGTLYRLAAGPIPVGAGEGARTLSPPGVSPVAAIEDDGFVRGVNATAAGGVARPALNVTSLATGGGGSPAAPGAGIEVALPADAPAYLVASFAEVRLPPGASARGIPADGLIELYIPAWAPAAQDVAGAFGVDADDVLEVPPIVEVGDNATRIVFDRPVRILLVGQSGGSAFYAGPDGAVVRIADICAADGTADEMHDLMGGSGACQADSADGRGKVVHTYHLTRFGTAQVDYGDTCGASLSSKTIGFGRVEAGGRSEARGPTITANGTLPVEGVSIGADDWTADADGVTVVMPANATSVRTAGGGGGGGAWTPLGGADFSVPWGAGQQSASVEFRLDVPGDALPAGATTTTASQAVTYTVTCGAPAE